MPFAFYRNSGKPVIVLALVAVSCASIVGMIMNPALIIKLWPIVTVSVKVVGALIVEIKDDWSPEQKEAVLAITSQ
uniref:Amino acid transporter n=1 Tax=Ditylenchus dipsaci TaxID=166011 RepID=A0A915EFR1_9BILA